MTQSPPSPSASVPDYDGDSDPGLTIKSSGGGENESDPQKWQEWMYTPAAPLVLNGPVTLNLWATIRQFELNKDAHPHMYLYDCDGAGTNCVKIAENDVHIDDWNGGSPSWVLHRVTIGSVTRTMAAGRKLRLRLLNGHNDLWVAMTAAYPSSLEVTLG
jgi:hypothetical protein